MSNFICSECGMTNIDCGYAGYKTPKEIELEKKVHILNEANMKLENELGHFADLNKKVEHLQEQLKLAESTLVICALNRIYSSINAKEYLDKYVKGWDSDACEMKLIDSQTNTKKVVNSKKKKRVHKKLANNKIQANEYIYHADDFTPLAVGFLGEKGLKRWANTLKRGGKQ